MSRRKTSKSKPALAKPGEDGQLPLLEVPPPKKRAKLNARGAATAFAPDLFSRELPVPKKPSVRKSLPPKPAKPPRVLEELPARPPRRTREVAPEAPALPECPEAADPTEVQAVEEEPYEDHSWGGPATRFWNLTIGTSLLPFCWIFTTAIFEAFAKANIHGVKLPFWKTHEFLMFALGAVLWLGWFCLSLAIWRQPRPLRLYVWGHELMHVLFARCFGGTIKDYGISRDGGFIVTDRYNFLIALAPYLWPFAAVPILALWGLVAWIPEVLYYREWFLGALGFTWFFHLSFTAWMIPIGQTDFAGPGKVFSLALIYLVNLVLLSVCLVVLAPEVTMTAYARELWQSTLSFYGHILHAGESAYGWVFAK